MPGPRRIVLSNRAPSQFEPNAVCAFPLSELFVMKLTVGVPVTVTPTEPTLYAPGARPGGELPRPNQVSVPPVTNVPSPAVMIPKVKPRASVQPLNVTVPLPE